MKYIVKSNFFFLGKLYKAGAYMDIKPEDEGIYKGNIEKVAIEQKVTKKGKVR